MVGLLVALLVGMAATAIYINNLQATNASLSVSKLNSELRILMDLMMADIRRAGYYELSPLQPFSKLTANAAFTKPTVVDNTVSPPVTVEIENDFMIPGQTDISVQDWDGGTRNCIVLAYDGNRNGLVDPNGLDDGAPGYPGDANELFGYRLDADEGTIDVRVGGITTCAPDGANAGAGNCDMGCSAGSWQAANDPNIVEVTNLQFTVLGNNAEATTSDREISRCFNTTRTVADLDAVAGREDFWDSLCSDFPTALGNPPCTDAADDTQTNYACEEDVLVEKRVVQITLTGRLAGDTSITKTVTGDVKVRNDRLIKVQVPTP